MPAWESQQSNTRPVFCPCYVVALKAQFSALPDRRQGDNTMYAMGDFGMAAFSVFFTQSPSFLSHQTALARGRGTSNCQTLFGMGKIPTDNQIRSMLDPVPPELLFPMFGRTLAALEAGGGLDAFRRLDGHVLIALVVAQHASGMMEASISARKNCPVPIAPRAPVRMARPSISTRLFRPRLSPPATIVCCHWNPSS